MNTFIFAATKGKKEKLMKLLKLKNNKKNIKKTNNNEILDNTPEILEYNKIKIKKI